MPADCGGRPQAFGIACVFATFKFAGALVIALAPTCCDSTLTNELAGTAGTDNKVETAGEPVAGTVDVGVGGGVGGGVVRTDGALEVEVEEAETCTGAAMGAAGGVVEAATEAVSDDALGILLPPRASALASSSAPCA